MRGTLEGCILKIISTGETYGYEITTRLQQLGFENVKEGTIYPLLVRLEKKHMIFGEFRPSPLGPSRKYFGITDKGIELLNDFALCWEQVSSAVNQILHLEQKLNFEGVNDYEPVS